MVDPEGTQSGGGSIMTKENTIKLAMNGVELIRSGNRQSARGRTKSSRSRGLQRICEGYAKLRQASSQAGRIVKKEKQLKKKYQVQTLTECFGIPWRILTKRKRQNI